MTISRWKLLSGVLGVAIAGVAATADPPCPQGLGGCCPVGVPVTAAVQAPVPAPQLPPPVSVPVPSLPTLEIIALPEPPKPEVPVIRLDAPQVPTLSVKLDPPQLPTPTPEFALPPPAEKAVELPRIDATRIPPQGVPALPASRPKVPEPVEPGTRVVVRLGSASPKFEVYNGEELLLKVASESLDVRTPAKGGLSPLKATGGVKFTAPGCEGTCTELVVVPGTGEVELTGDVRVKCKHDKGETEVTATTMRFKLGTASYTLGTR